MPEPHTERTSKENVEATLGVSRNAASASARGLRWLLVVVLAVAVMAGAYYALGAGGSSGTVQYRTDPASRGDITAIVTATGTVEPTNKVDISSELSGIVRSVAVDFNSTVETGQILAELDTDKLEASVASSRARVAAAKARVAEAEATVAEKQYELTRKQELARSRIVSSQDLEAAKAAFDRANATLASTHADVEAAEADLRLNETNLKKTCICSPIDGVVLSRNVDPGQVVASSLQAPVLFTIAEDLSQMEVRVDVDEADVGKVRQGQLATFTVDAYPDRRFEARIRELRFGSEVVQGVVTYKAVLTTNNSELLLRPGMTATAEITVQEEKNVLTVSNEGLRYTPETEKQGDGRSFLQMLIPSPPRFRPSSRPELAGSERELWVMRDGVATPIAVTVGTTDGQRTQVVSGEIGAGDEIIVDTIASAT